MPRAFILQSSRSLYTPLQAPLISKLIKLNTHRPRHAVQIYSCKSISAYSADRYFRAPKWLVRSKPYTSIACEILSATTDSSILPSVARSEISLHAFVIVQFSLFSFLSGMIFACLHYLGNMPSSSDAWNKSRTLCLTIGHVIFQTIAGRPSSPGAFYDFAIKSCRSTSSRLIVGIPTGSLCGLVPSSLIILGRGGKNLDSSSSAYS